MMKTRISFFALIASLVIASLACNQAGQVLTPEEATAVARGEPVGESSQGGAASSGTSEGQFAVDQQVQFVGTGFLIPITGDILRMPGLSKLPAAYNIDIDDEGNISGVSSPGEITPLT